MKCLVFFALVASSYAASTPFTWSDCATPPSGQASTCSCSTPVQFNYLSISPNPIVFPGYMTVDTSITINRPIIDLYVDIDLKKKTSFGPYLDIPCLGDSKIGSCQNFDVCNLLRDVKNDTSTAYNDFRKQIRTILVSALGSLPQCPLHPAKIVMTSETIFLKAMPDTFANNIIADGYFHVTLTLKESPTSTESVGCLDVHFGTTRPSTGFLFG